MAGRRRDPFRRQRRAQYDVASAEAEGNLRADCEGARRGCGAGAAGGQSSGGVRGPADSVGAGAGGRSWLGRFRRRAAAEEEKLLVSLAAEPRAGPLLDALPSELRERFARGRNYTDTGTLAA